MHSRHPLFPIVTDDDVESIFLDLQDSERCLHVISRYSVCVTLGGVSGQHSEGAALEEVSTTGSFVPGSLLMVGTKCLYITATFSARGVPRTLRIPYECIEVWRAKDSGSPFHPTAHTDIYLSFFKYYIVRNGDSDVLVERTGREHVRMWLQVGRRERLLRYQGHQTWHSSVQRLVSGSCADEVWDGYLKSSRVVTKGVDGMRAGTEVGCDYHAEATSISPFCEIIGRLTVRRDHLKFTPYCSDEEGVVSVRLDQLSAVRKRTYVLDTAACEVFFWDGGGNIRSIFLLFQNDEMLQKFQSVLDPVFAAKPSALLPLKDAQREWRHGRMSNFDYIMLLNDLAGRSFKNIYQYPVFPWVLSDYNSPKLDLNDPRSFRDLTKPAAALCPSRVENGIEMYHALQDVPGIEQPWMYGSHYSNPGIIAHFKVRQWPKLMLRLQGGRFDNPNRMFYGITSAWDSIVSNIGDVKELIPELYHPDLGLSLLCNDRHINLGTRSNGERLGDVVLPPWATSPRDFLEKMQHALESKYVSAHLHTWIDLVFGCASSGKRAVECLNVFHYMTYDDIAIRCVSQSVAAALEAREFGRTPNALFGPSKHPSKKRRPTSLFTCVCSHAGVRA
jgi:hypothetical protein